MTMDQAKAEASAWLTLEMLRDFRNFVPHVSIEPVVHQDWCKWKVTINREPFVGQTPLEAIKHAVDGCEDLDIAPCRQCERPVVTLPDGLTLCRGCAAAEELEN